MVFIDHCRIGSLEKPKNGVLVVVWDHCRIGSLETAWSVTSTLVR